MIYLYFLFFILFSSFYCQNLNQQPESDFVISLNYLQQSSSQPDIINQKCINVYQNSTLNSTFFADHSILDCANTNLFTLDQTQSTNNYTLLLSNFQSPTTVEIQSGFNNPLITNTTCNNSISCSINLNTNCSSGYSNNYIKGLVYPSGYMVISFEYYTQCNYSTTNFIQFIEWGYILVVFLSIGFIWLSSKFQQAQSFDNFTLYINYVIVIIYSILCILKFLLIRLKVNNIILAINYICIIGSFILGIISVWVCICELMHSLKIQFLSKQLCSYAVIKVRVMDIIGFLCGVGVLCAWFFTSNAIISDFIFFMIYLTLMKFIKFGSLKIALILFVINFVIFFIFYHTAEVIDDAYSNTNYFYFNNPLFLMVPNFAHIPNRKCTWYSIITMSFQGFILCYLQRFDKNKSSQIYAPIFLACYALGGILWLVVSPFTPFALPYDLFIIPIAMFILLFFANRRGQLLGIWEGDFYDEQKAFFSNLPGMKQNFRSEKNNGSLKQSFLEYLKFDDSILEKQSIKGGARSNNQQEVHIEMSQQRTEMARNRTIWNSDISALLDRIGKKIND